MKRRSFLETVGLSVLGSVILSEFNSFGSDDESLSEIGLQLYTVRNEMKKDPVSTLKKVADIGYKYVECTGYENGKFYDNTKENFRKILNDLGLKMLSGHVDTGFNKGEKTMGLRYRFDSVCEDAVFIGQKYLGVGYMPIEERKTIDDYKKFANLLNKSAEIAKKYGLTFFHHNHDFEFVPITGIIPYDLLLKETDKNLVKFELDHYWTTKANVDSINIMKNKSGRFHIWHIKDMDNTPDRAFTEVGTGIIDYGKIFKNKKIAGGDLIFIEQDSCKKIPPLESIELSFKNLKNLKF